MKTALLGTLTLVAGCILGVAIQASEKIQGATETKVELKRVHMCCEGCADEVSEVLTKVKGVKSVTVVQEANTARFVATDAKTAQAALDALATAGFHGDSGTKDFAFKDDSGVKAGKVKVLALSGFHNTCAGCVLAFRAALKDVPGVAADNLKPNVTTCEIRGDFDAAAVVQALNKAGFHVKVKN